MMNKKILMLLSLLTFLFSAEEKPTITPKKNPSDKDLSCAISNGQAQGCNGPIKKEKSAVNILLSHDRDIFNAYASVSSNQASSYNYLMPLDIFGKDLTNKEIDLGGGFKMLNYSNDGHDYDTLIKGDYLSDASKRTALQGASVEVKKDFDFAKVAHSVGKFFRRLFRE